MTSVHTSPFQYERDQERFVELIKKYTGIPKQTLVEYLKEHNIQDMYEHPDTLDVSDERKQKLQEIAEIRRLYQNLRDHDREYKLNSPMAVSDYFSNYYSEKRDREYVAVAFLNSQLNVIKTEVLSEGTVDSAMISPRDIAKKALIYDSKAVVMAHNHPGGSDKPSMADITMTQRVQNALELFDIQLVDHIVVAGEGNTNSIRALGHISEPTAPYSQSLNEVSDEDGWQPESDQTSLLYEKHLKTVLKELGKEVDIVTKEDLLKAQDLLAECYVDLVYDKEEGFDKIDANEAKKRTLLSQHLDSSQVSLFTNGVSEVVVSPSAKKAGMYQLTYFDKYGASMDSLRSSKEECVRELRANNLVPLRKEFAEYVRELDQNESIAKSLNFLTDQYGANHFYKLKNEPLQLVKIEKVHARKQFSDYHIQLEDVEQNRFNYLISSPKTRMELLKDWSKAMTGDEWLNQDIKSEALRRSPNLTLSNSVPELSERAKPLDEFAQQEKAITQHL